MANDEHIEKDHGDPLARVFLIAVAVLFFLGVVMGLRVLLTTDTEPTRTTTTSTPGIAEAMHRRFIEAMNVISDILTNTAPQTEAPPPRQPPQTSHKAPAASSALEPAMTTGDPKRAYDSLPTPKGPQVSTVPAGGRWTYDVFFGPCWQMNGQLQYSTQQQTENKITVGANMSWIPNGGQPTTWFLGVMEPDHPSHANTRFPGFFMHPVYLPPSPQPGSLVVWEFPWQGGGKAQMRRFDMRVAGWESVTVPAGVFDAVHLQGTLRYVDSEVVKAEVRYELWYAPKARQIVRLLWLGRAPEEAAAEMIAELAGFTLP